MKTFDLYEIVKQLNGGGVAPIGESNYQGDTLYKESSWDGGIEFNYIRPIKYCPICGKELPKYD